MTTKYYDADQISIMIAGIPVTGFAEDDFVSLEQETDDFSDVVGADSEVTRSKSNDRRATCTIRLMQTSDSNDLLTALSNTDLKAPNGAGVGAFLIRDRSGRGLWTAAACWVQRPPNVDFGREAKEREWVIRIANLERFDGGN